MLIMQKNIKSIAYILLFYVANIAFSDSQTPDFKKIPAGQQRVAAFIDYMSPKIKYVNKQVCQQRKKILNILNQVENKQTINVIDQEFIKQSVSEYKLNFSTLSEANLSALLNRVNIIPISIVLSQAAVESGWGTSRFARVANNYFGEHCFKKGCGIAANKDSNVEVSKFKSVIEGIESYYLMLNRRTVFESFRKVRQSELSKNQSYNIQKLVNTLTIYSGIGDKYPKILLQIIQKYNLAKFDTNTALCLF
ncbi:glucosaminidase domain-containing protein [Francisellaceae bacterium]|nr:glucosaminidase domain-containing protein [Francisellaceae bacterium]